jgi:hypothetical protein
MVNIFHLYYFRFLGLHKEEDEEILWSRTITSNDDENNENSLINI